MTPPIRLTLLLALVLGALLVPATASASRDQVTILQDDNQLLGSNGDRREATLDEW